MVRANCVTLGYLDGNYIPSCIDVYSSRHLAFGTCHKIPSMSLVRPSWSDKDSRGSYADKHRRSIIDAELALSAQSDRCCAIYERPLGRKGAGGKLRKSVTKATRSQYSNPAESHNTRAPVATTPSAEHHDVRAIPSHSLRSPEVDKLKYVFK
jgi:hypothetical protein